MRGCIRSKRTCAGAGGVAWPTLSCYISDNRSRPGRPHSMTASWCITYFGERGPSTYMMAPLVNGTGMSSILMLETGSGGR